MVVVYRHNRLSRREVVEALRQSSKGRHPELYEALKRIQVDETQMETKVFKVSELDLLMVLDEDVKTTTGLLLASAGQEITGLILARLLNFARGVGVAEPFRVLVPR